MISRNDSFASQFQLLAPHLFFFYTFFSANEDLSKMPNAISTVTFLDVNVTEFTNLSKPILFTAVHDTIPTKTESTILTIHHLIKSDKSTFRPSPSRVLAKQTCHKNASRESLIFHCRQINIMNIYVKKNTYILTRFCSKLNGLVPVSLVFTSPVLNVYLIGCSAGRETDKSKGQQSRRIQNFVISRSQRILRIFVILERKTKSRSIATRPFLNKSHRESRKCARDTFSFLFSFSCVS